MPILAGRTPEVAEGYWQAKRTAAQAVAMGKDCVWEEFGEALYRDSQSAQIFW